MSADQILIGTGLTVALAVASQILAGRLRVPAIIVLLPVGFTAGAITDVVDPDDLLGPAFSPYVSLAVAVILYEAGLSLNVRHLDAMTRRVVVRLLGVGVPVTCAVVGLTSSWLLGLSAPAALMLGVILVVSGPTVVTPLLDFVRPVPRLQRVLTWEGVLIDPLGAILGALVLHAIVATSGPGSLVGNAGKFVGSVGTGLLGGLLGAAVLWLVLVRIRPGEVLDASAQLAVVLLVTAVCDALRDDSGLVAAIVMGLVVANRREFDLPVRRPFLETIVQLIIGLLFISISATVTPASLRGVALPTAGLVVALVVVGRPLVTALATVHSPLGTRERVFVGWMAPRGIVAAATASTFGAALVAADVSGAGKILPVTFLVIVLTVCLYGLTAESVARRLGVVRSVASRPLIVGDDPWVVDLAKALRDSGVKVVVAGGNDEQRRHIAAQGLELARGELLAAATGQDADLEEITMVLLLSADDDFNALASALLEGGSVSQVYRLPSRQPGEGAVAPYLGGHRLFREDLTGAALDRRHRAGARIVTRPASVEPEPGQDLLFVIRPDGVLVPSLDGETPALSDGGTCVVLTAPDLATERSTRVHTGQQVASADATARFEAGGSAGGSSRAED